MSLFSRKKNKSSKTSVQSTSTSLSLPSSSNGNKSKALPLPAPPPSRFHVDDFGRQIVPNQAFTDGQGVTGSGEGLGQDEELALIFGYSPIATIVELRIEKVVQIVACCAAELRARGLTTPLVLSNMSLDISLDGSCSLIRAYLSDLNLWRSDLQLAAPLCIGTHLKWALARLVNDQGERGFVSWDTYESFKAGERAGGYHLRFITTNLMARLPSSSASLLDTLLSLFSSVSAYSLQNGMTPRKISSLFAPYVFGLADDQTFDATYAEWSRITDAFEHILLAYIRDQGSISQLPTHLQKFIINYPRCLNITYDKVTTPQPPKGAKTERVLRFRRQTRFHSRNLIKSAGTWEVPNSASWAAFFPLNLPLSSSQGPKPMPLTTPQYRHMLNIRAQGDGMDDDEGEMQRYKSVVEKEWGQFGTMGFKEIATDKLEFDLTEGERTKIVEKRGTIDWGTFADSGFGGRETFAPSDLIFRQNISQRVRTWPSTQRALSTRLHEVETRLPPFPYDTTVQEESPIFVESLFFEAWADVLVCAGWVKDELKESNFALLQWRSRPKAGEAPKQKVSLGGDPSETRTEDKWVLVEEFVPREYRDELASGKKKTNPSKRISFLRAVRKKPPSNKLPPSRFALTPIPSRASSTQDVVAPLGSPYLPPPNPNRFADDSVYTNDGETKLLSLSNVHLSPSKDYARSVAPSVTSTTAAGHGHTSSIMMDDFEVVPRPPPISPIPTERATSPYIGYGIGGTLSSQKRESAFATARQRDPTASGVGYTKPDRPPSAGFLGRFSSMRSRSKGKKSGSSSNGDTSSVGTIEELGSPLSPSWRPAQAEADRRAPTPTNASASNLSPPPSASTTNGRGSAYSTTTSVEELEDPAVISSGTVVFRGSASLSREVSVTGNRLPAIVLDSPKLVRPLPNLPPAPVTEAPGRKGSLPHRPRPEADLPVDEEFPPRRSPESSSRVKAIVGAINEGKKPSPVRLTTFFTQEKS